MKANQQSAMDFLGASRVQFVVPIYQRVYTWQAPQLRELWDDIMSAGKSGGTHFLGNIFFSRESSHYEGVEQLDIIDGQQRLTTLTLLMCALAKYLNLTGQTVGGRDAKTLANRFLTTSASEAKACKLVLSRADAPTLRWIVGVGDRPAADEERSERVAEAYEWFCGRFEEEGFDLDVFAKGIEGLFICAVLMEEGDRRQTVFESLNAKGLSLSAPDLVRNYLLMCSEHGDRAYLYDTYWADVEDAFAQDADDRYLANAIRLWTGAGKAVKDERGIFEAFKASLSHCGKDVLEGRVASLASYCLDFHGKIASGDEAAVKDCKEWEESRGKAERLSNNRKIFGD